MQEHIEKGEGLVTQWEVMATKSANILMGSSVLQEVKTTFYGCVERSKALRNKFTELFSKFKHEMNYANELYVSLLMVEASRWENDDSHKIFHVENIEMMRGELANFISATNVVHDEISTSVASLHFGLIEVDSSAAALNGALFSMPEHKKLADDILRLLKTLAQVN